MNKLEQSRRAFDKQASTYDHDFHGEHARTLYPFLLQKIIQTSAKDVLDLGCGSAALMKQVYDEDSTRHLYGLDLSEQMLLIAQQTMKAHAQLTLGDAHQLPYQDNSFDLVYCNDSFHHYPDPFRVIQEVHRVLRPEGLFLIGESYQPFLSRFLMNAFFRFSKEGDVHMYHKKEFQALLQPYFHSMTYELVTKRCCIVCAQNNEAL